MLRRLRSWPTYNKSEHYNSILSMEWEINMPQKTHYVGGKGKIAKDFPPRSSYCIERVITDEDYIQSIISDWQQDRIVNLALSLLGEEARAWWARRKERQS